MIERLIELLEGINEGTVAYTTEIDEDDNVYVQCDEVEELAWDLLVGPQGSCNWRNIDKVRGAGFRVYPGDSDSFGWLVGCISTNKGIVTFG